MVNATEMAKPFGKRPAKWLELPSTQLFLNELETVRKSDSLILTEEGRNGGTWMHEDVALEFARWLSPAFAIWCN
ncbi:DNA-binding protein [Siphonobacter sp. BAB-5385]|uniref:KilA-N domain-containing protein n=1 Tax=Siphonobacter sp. BAB-5385 TaxID=1864822 RepID=UPI000B9E946D|nr:DNA-binding protein [Siphonobacter sp. BAB-5385]